MLSTADSSSPIRTSSAIGWDHIARVGPTTIVASVAANVLVYFAGDTLVSYDPQFLPLKNVSGVIVFTLAAAVTAVLRFAQRPARTFTTISAIVFILTLVPDFAYTPSVPGVIVGQTATLVLMHAVAAAVIVRILTTLLHPQSRQGRTQRP